jgi:hypothetical protein
MVKLNFQAAAASATVCGPACNGGAGAGIMVNELALIIKEVTASDSPVAQDLPCQETSET